MKTLLYSRALLFAIFLCCFSYLQAQDIHYSQFYNTPLQLNPALTGIFNGDMRFLANYKAQWYDVPITYRTAYGAFDMKFEPKEGRSNFFSAGGILNFDHAGDSKMGTLQFALNGAYTVRLAKNHFLSGGVQGTINQRSFKTEDLVFDEQFAGKDDPAPFNTESFDRQSVFYADFGLGLNWHMQKRKSRTRLDLGGGLFHINEPKKNFFNEEDAALPRKWSLYGLGVLQLAKKFDLVLSAMGQYQSPYTEQVIAGAGRIHLDTRKTRELALQFGLAYRWNAEGFGTGDALIPAAQLHHKAWIFGLSYDINLSDFKPATGGFGGPEFSVIYVFRKVPAVDFCPTCPVYL